MARRASAPVAYTLPLMLALPVTTPRRSLRPALRAVACQQLTALPGAPSRSFLVTSTRVGSCRKHSSRRKASASWNGSG